jgi:serine/threonine protein kinase
VRGYDYLVDYWSLGCIIFEFLVGYPPFSADSMAKVWYNVLHWEEKLVRPHYEGDDTEFNLTDEAWSLLISLIAHRHRRLQSYASVQQHPWFRPLNECLSSVINASKPSGRRLQQRPHPRTATVEDSVGEDLWLQLRSLPVDSIHNRADGGIAIILPPYIPEITNETDPRHFDDFSAGGDAEIYRQVFERRDRLNAHESKSNLTAQERNQFRLFTFHRNFI